MKRHFLMCLIAASALGAPLVSHSEDAAKALGGLLNGLLKQPAAPAQSTGGGGALGGLLGLGGGQSQQNNPKEWISLLSQSVEQIDEPKAIEIGKQLASVLLGAKPLHNNLALQRYVNRLGRWISLHSSRPDLPWTFAVLDDAGFNAFATPGGYVFITKGLVDAVADESELAGILAHEITHVVGKHHLKAIRKNAQSGLLTKAVASQLKSDAGGLVSEQLLNMGREMYSKGLDQTDEFEADREGVVLAVKAGFDPYGLVSILQQLRQVRPDDPAFTLALSTHPATQTRLDQLEQAMGQRLDGYAGTASMSVAQRMARGSR